MLKKILFISTHLIFWIVFITFSLVIGFRVDESWVMFMKFYEIYIIQLIWAGSIFYLSYFFFAVKYFEKRQLIKHLIFSTLVSILIPLFFIGIIAFLFQLNWSLIKTMSLRSMVGTFIIAQCGVLLRGFLNWYVGLERKSEIEKQNLQNELTVLKQQLNPHFLFNTLNNIDAMIQSQPKEASKAIIKLSEMLRYMIYETNTDKVNLFNEKKYLQNLVALHSMRHKNADYISFVTNIEYNEIKVAPMIFLPFVENAFKFATDIGKYPCISIELFTKDKTIHFICKNYFNKFAKKDNNTSSGFGLTNVKKRLNLIYGNNHQLNLNIDDNLYKVELKIMIDAN